MYSHTKKVGSIGRYGPRVGWKIRMAMRKIEDKTKAAKKCPECGKLKLKRESAGIWKCRACKVMFTGGAHLPVTERK
ncbi:MAG: 50S ribosomal protein L37ae [Candidatus Altiarchaeales archaeon HGW-Altiarchaeales-3]|nr:MAG: 50S ribosomal protein L37ae [Candidatus Altiarchaeales archaeon HGW-Altiarchaeales-3]